MKIVLVILLLSLVFTSLFLVLIYKASRLGGSKKDYSVVRPPADAESTRPAERPVRPF